MKKLLIVSSFLTVSLFGQNLPQPVITAVEPTIGPSTGGTFVTIIGTNIGPPDGFACLLPCPPIVRFGSAEVEAAVQSKTVLVVRTPPHEPGTVDVTVRTPDGRFGTAPNAYTFSPFPEAGFERVLVPIYLDGQIRGGHGSIWGTELWIRNHGSGPVTLAVWPCVDVVCLPVFPSMRSILPNETIRNLPPFFRPPTGNPARILYITAPDRIAANLRVFDLSRDQFDAGTELPLVHERDLLTNTAHLLSFPLGERFRLTLRIYELTQSEARFHVRLYRQREGLVVEPPLRTVDLTARTSETGAFRTLPAYVEYAFPVEGLSGLGRLEIEPVTTGVRFWAFVSVTNNETQRVTLVTP